MDADAASAVGLAVATVLAGCLGPLPGVLVPGAGDGDATPRDAWTQGEWWSYRVETAGGEAAESAFVVHEARADGYRLGANGTHGFFGIPFHGEVRPDLDPVVAGERWDMFRFPLADGDTWVQEFLGHAVTTRVHEADLPTPGGRTVDGYRLEASAYGVDVATYTYAPSVGWLTSFTLRDPESGRTLAWANLTGHGEAFDGRYLVEEPVGGLERTYPGDVPGRDRIHVGDDGVRLVATLTAVAQPGTVEASLEDPGGEAVLEVEATGSERRDARERADLVPGDWTLDHRGVGSGEVRVQLHVVQEAGSGSHVGEMEAERAGGDPLEGTLPDVLPAPDGG